MPSLFRCAHISDLHFSKPTWNPSQFFSKRWLGNFNLLFSRRHTYTPRYFPALIDTFKKLSVQNVFITGDLSTTSLEAEFEMAKDFIDNLKKAGLNVFTLPGNHDQYTRAAYRDRLFYQFFDASFSNSAFDLCTDGLTVHKLHDKWWLIALDTAIATPWISSCGNFSFEQEKKLEKALSEIPSKDRVILINHYPLFQNDSPRKILKRAAALKALVQRFPNIAFYLHGHTHRHCIADLRPSQFPILLDSGSTAHNGHGSWNLIDIHSEKTEVTAYRLTKDMPSSESEIWQPTSKHSFKW